MRTSLGFIAAGTLAIAACSGGDGGGTQPQTEEAAIAATTKGLRGTFVNNASDVLNFMNEECRASVDAGEVRQALIFAQVFFQSDDYDLSDIEVRGTATEFSEDAATIAIELIAPEGADLDFLSPSDDEVDVIYENEKWVAVDCDFEDSTESSSDELEADLEALGISATQDSPAPAQLALPVGGGFTVAVTDYTADAADLITSLGGTEPFIEDGQQIALVAYDIAYNGSEEPVSLSSPNLQLVGADGVGISQTGCGNMDNQAFFGSTEVFSGGSASVVSCFAATPAEFDTEPLISIEVGFNDRPVFVAPTTTAEAPTMVTGSVGPSPDGDLTDSRTAPTPIATPIDIDEGWTMTVNGADLDADDAVLGASDFNDPPPDGQVYVLLDVTLAFDGDEPTSSLFSVDIGLVGDSNVAANDSCSASSLPDEMDRFADIFPGGSMTGTVCFLVDESDVESLVAYATAETFGDSREFFALS